MEDDAGFKDQDVDLGIHGSMDVTAVVILVNKCVIGSRGRLGLAAAAARCLSNLCVCSSTLGLSPEHETRAEVINQERQKETSHEYCRSYSLVFDGSDAFILEHELGVCEELGPG